MYTERTVREAGERIWLENKEYEIVGQEGAGGSCVVYRAFYRDRLIEEQKHWVLIKELYPITRNDSVRRSEQGDIRWDREEERCLDRDRFLRGNEVNLKLLEDHPEKIAGNLINCEAYGTYYSIIPLQGGEILKRGLERGRGFRLREAAVIVKQILEGLQPFHERGLIHLDISPDNILIHRGWAMLIDFDSAWSLDELAEGAYDLSGKTGYTAPEIYMPEEWGSVGFAADIYSVCAVFFELLTGKQASEISGYLTEAALYRYLKNCSVFEAEPAPAFLKTAEILMRGLDASASGRYQSIEQMAEQLDELLLRVDHRGVSHSALWECQRRTSENLTADQFEYIPQSVKITAPCGKGALSEADVTLKELSEMVAQGSNILLSGPGGLGKTRLLKELAATYARQYQPDQPVFFYIYLGEYQAEREEDQYIQRQLMRYLNFSDNMEHMSDMEHELELFLDRREKEHVNLVLLLDGLNEAAKNGKALIPEIERLSRKAGVAILAADRTDVILEHALFEFSGAVLQPLPEKAVQDRLSLMHVEEPEEAPLREMLANPMLLELYIKMTVLETENGVERKPDGNILTADDLVQRYLENQLTVMQRGHHDSRAQQLKDLYILNHFLPSVAQKMGARSLIRGSEMADLVRKSYEELNHEQFRDRFPEFRGYIGEILENEDQWYGCVVGQLLSLALISKCGEDSYRLIHDNFKNYLLKLAKEHDDKMGMTDEEFQETLVELGKMMFAIYGIGSLVSSAIKKAIRTNAVPTRKEAEPYTRISYYADAAERYGVPFGIHPIKAKDLKNVNSYIEMRISSDGKTDIRAIRVKKGAEPWEGISVSEDRIIQSNYCSDCRVSEGIPVVRVMEVERGGICYQQRFEEKMVQTEHGLARISCLVRDGVPSSLKDLEIAVGAYERGDVTRIKEYYSEEGCTKYMMFLEGSSGEDYAADSHAAAGIEYEYDAKGRETAEFLVDADMKRISIEGVAGIGCVYDERDDLIVFGRIDEEEELVNGSDGWSYFRQTYDSYHNAVQIEYYDKDGCQAEGPEGVFCIRITYKAGCITAVSYHDHRGKMCRSRMGYARLEYSYAHGILSAKSCYDERKRLCEGDEGYAVETVKLCREGKNGIYLPQEVSFWDSNRRSCVSTRYGAEKIRYGYDKDGNWALESAADGGEAR